MVKIDYYKDLDLDEIKTVAYDWALEYPILKKIVLFRGVGSKQPKKYMISVEFFNLTELIQIAESLSYKNFKIYVKESQHYIPFFGRAVTNDTYGDLDEKLPVAGRKDFLKYAKKKVTIQ